MTQQPPHWRFMAMMPAQMNENPVQGEFFSSASDLPGRLVREAIQNSLDAARIGPDGQPWVVRVRFAFSATEHQLPADDAERYLRGLREHVGAVAADDQTTGHSQAAAASQNRSVSEERAIYDARNLLDQPMRYLAVEDFGTSGLTGDVRANDVSADGNNFWGFFRQIGISTKGENAAGSWGLGKWVFPDASDINSLLALTRRAGEDETLMMGLAILKTHAIDERKYPAYGHFVRADKRPDAEWMQMPVSSRDETDFIERALTDFQLQRGEESGLSVIIPWPNQELTPATIARAAVTQYFLPIVKGVLEIEIEHPGEERRVINSATLKQEVARIAPSENNDDEVSPEAMIRLLGLVEWAVQQESGASHISLNIPTRGSNPLTDPESKIDLEQLRERYNNNIPLAFELSLDVQRAGADHATSVACRVYIQRDEYLTRGHDYFVRGHLNIPAMDLLGSLRARTLLLVPGNTELGHLLRDAENPAHTDWKVRDRAKQNWETPGRPIEQVRLAPQRLVRALVERPVERQMDALADLFPSNVAASTPAQPGNGPGNGTTIVLPPRPSEPTPVRLGKVDGGFSLLPNHPYPVKVADTTWRVKFAYELARGGRSRAFTLFQKGVKDGCPDFSLRKGLTYQCSGCMIDIIADNELLVHIGADQFNLSISGFDPNRDVLVEVDQEKPEQNNLMDENESP